MNWLAKIAQKSLIDEIRSQGWAEDQLRMDAVQIHKRNNKFFISVGDWAQVNIDDLIGAIERIYPGSETDYEYEGGPEGDGWKRIF